MPNFKINSTPAPLVRWACNRFPVWNRKADNLVKRVFVGLHVIVYGTKISIGSHATAATILQNYCDADPISLLYTSQPQQNFAPGAFGILVNLS